MAADTADEAAALALQAQLDAEVAAAAGTVDDRPLPQLPHHLRPPHALTFDEALSVRIIPRICRQVATTFSPFHSPKWLTLQVAVGDARCCAVCHWGTREHCSPTERMLPKKCTASMSDRRHFIVTRGCIQRAININYEGPRSDILQVAERSRQLSNRA